MKKTYELSTLNPLFEERGYQLLEEEDIYGSDYKIHYICKKHPEKVQEITIGNFLQGRGCRFCKQEKINTINTTKIKDIRQEFLNKGLIILNKLDDDTVTYTQKIEIKCIQHPDIIQYKSLRNIRDNPIPCSFCNHHKIYPYDIKNKLLENGYVWEDFRENISSHDTLSVFCLKHKIIFETTPLQTKRTQPDNLCPLCAKEHNTLGNGKYTIEDAKKAFEDSGYILIEQEYEQCSKKMKYICPKHGEQKISLSKLLQGQGCPACHQSKGEKQIEKVLQCLGIDFISQEKFEDCKYIKKLVFDFYLPIYKTCIEYQGEHHYQATPFNQARTKENYEKARKKFEKQKEKDEIKRQYCKSQKLALLEIDYFNYNNINKILYNFLLNRAKELGIPIMSEEEFLAKIN